MNRLALYNKPDQIWIGFKIFTSTFLSILGAENLIFSVFNIDLNINVYLYWFIFLFPAIIFGIWRALPKTEAKATIKDTDICISCKICNMLNMDGDYVISVNNTFDTETKNDFISPDSLQGKFQHKFFKGKTQELNKIIQKELEGKEIINIHKDGRPTNLKEYPIGTILKINVSKGIFVQKNFHTYLLALSKSNKHGTTSTTQEDFSQSLQMLWIFLKEKGHKTRLCIPLIGTGRSGLKLEKMAVAKEIIFSFIAFSKSSRIVNELVICFTTDDYTNSNLDLINLQEYLSVMCNNVAMYHSQTTDQNDLSKPVPVFNKKKKKNRK